jgi:capsular polysaccharide export protein
LVPVKLDCAASNDREVDARLGIKVISGAASILLKENDNLSGLDNFGGRAAMDLSSRLPKSLFARPFLRVPPFPGARLRQFREMMTANINAFDAGEALCRLRVGGTFWGAQPELPSDYILVRSSDAIAASRHIWSGQPCVFWPAVHDASETPNIPVIRGECDPWHMLASASAVVTEADDEVRLVAALLGVKSYTYDQASGRLETSTGDAVKLLRDALAGTSYENPFTGEPMGWSEAIELCGFWRSLIDSNRDVVAGVGFAFWKQDHVAPLLWGGSDKFRFLSSGWDVPDEGTVAIWRAKTAPQTVAELDRRQGRLIEVEDGFVRSHGLGADCIPPLSITVDSRGAHFDPGRSSDLECLLEIGDFDTRLVARARELRQLIVDAGIGKYGHGSVVLERPAGARRHILVPGQVEDDRAVQVGGCGLASNLELLRRVREQAPDAYILYKPHPDVVAGHRRGSLRERDCLELADEIVGELPIASVIDMVDEVHINTSLAGFEALVRGKPVTTYGVPFYAGWGLTCDLGPVPSRRTARRTIDELVAAALLLYPRYLDPETGLPCPAEVVVQRLRLHRSDNAGLLVGVRRLQGKLMRRLRSLVQ